MKRDGCFVRFKVASDLLVSLFDRFVVLLVFDPGGFDQRNVVLCSLLRKSQNIAPGRSEGHTFSFFFRTVLISPFLVMRRSLAAL